MSFVLCFILFRHGNNWSEMENGNRNLCPGMVRWRYVLKVVIYLLDNSSYGSGTVNSNTVNSKFHLIRSFFEIFARFLSFHV